MFYRGLYNKLLSFCRILYLTFVNCRSKTQDSCPKRSFHNFRNCGLVFCNRCSGHNVPLPQFGMERPVRVCNRCYLLHQFPEDLLSPVGHNGGNSRFFSGGDSLGGSRAGRNSSGGGGGGSGNNNPAASQHRNRRSPRSAPPSTSRKVFISLLIILRLRCVYPHALTRCISFFSVMTSEFNSSFTFSRIHLLQ